MKSFYQLSLLTEAASLPNHSELTSNDQPTEIVDNMINLFGNSINRSIEQNIEKESWGWRTKHNPVYDPKVNDFKQYLIDWAKKFFHQRPEIIQHIVERLNHAQKNKATYVMQMKLSGGEVEDREKARLGRLSPVEYAALNSTDPAKIKAAVQEKFNRARKNQQSSQPNGQVTNSSSQQNSQSLTANQEEDDGQPKKRRFVDKFRNLMNQGTWK